jgi:hypothetical protein
MAFEKHAQNISLQTIIVAVLVLIVLVLLIFIFRGKIGSFNNDAGSCTLKGGTCQDQAACLENGGTGLTAKDCAEQGQVCCVTVALGEQDG